MGLFLGLRKDEGVHIPTMNPPADIILREINGTMTEREAEFEVRGVRALDWLVVSYEDGLVRVARDLLVGVREGKYQRGGGKVEVHVASYNHKIDRRRYCEYKQT